MKKFMSLLLVGIMMLSLVACGKSGGGKGELNVGVFYYTYSDTYISSVRTALDSALTEAGIKFQNYDGNSNQTTQNEQIQTALTDGYNLLIVNMATSGSPDVANEIIPMANGTPVIFFNRAIEADGNEGTVLNANATISFIGTDAPEAGHLQGKMVGEYLLANWDTVDLNGDGKITYIMCKGDPENIDAQYRTEYSIKALTDADKEVECLYEYLDNWDQTTAQQDVANALAQYGEKIEVVFCNNDAMALGALQSIEQAGRTVGKDIYLVGVDALKEAVQNVVDGKMTGTVLNDDVGQATAAAEATQLFVEGKDVEEYYWVDYVKVTTENAAQYL